MITTPLLVLLLFACWTILILFLTVGIYRWKHILTGRREIKEFRADNAEGLGWYSRGMRAHANCIENLPVYGAIVLVLVVTGIGSPVIDILSIVLIIARVIQSTVHVAFRLSNLTVSIRFGFYLIQMICMIWMIAIILIKTI